MGKAGFPTDVGRVDFWSQTKIATGDRRPADDKKEVSMGKTLKLLHQSTLFTSEARFR
jgi:hypothetical protein